MSILSWLKHFASDETPSEMTFAANEQQFYGLDMKSALDAHLEWTQRLEAPMNGSSAEELEVAIVASDCHCILGKWIHGEAKQQFSQLPEYRELQRIHADFHLTAGEILRQIQSRPGDGSVSLKPIQRQSGSVQLALVRLYARAQEH